VSVPLELVTLLKEAMQRGASDLHLVVGKISFDKEKLLANLTAVLEAVRKAKPPSAKGTYIKSASICATMSPGVRIAV